IVPPPLGGGGGGGGGAGGGGGGGRKKKKTKKKNKKAPAGGDDTTATPPGARTTRPAPTPPHYPITRTTARLTARRSPTTPPAPPSAATLRTYAPIWRSESSAFIRWENSSATHCCHRRTRSSLSTNFRCPTTRPGSTRGAVGTPRPSRSRLLRVMKSSPHSVKAGWELCTRPGRSA